jgi:hypothetical protein
MKGEVMQQQKPTVGRMVHFAPPQACVGPESLTLYPAIITQVNPPVKGVPGDDGSDRPETVELVTFGPNSVYFQHKVQFAEILKPGTWSWPPRA